MNVMKSRNVVSITDRTGGGGDEITVLDNDGKPLLVHVGLKTYKIVDGKRVLVKESEHDLRGNHQHSTSTKNIGD